MEALVIDGGVATAAKQAAPMSRRLLAAAALFAGTLALRGILIHVEAFSPPSSQSEASAAACHYYHQQQPARSPADCSILFSWRHQPTKSSHLILRSERTSSTPSNSDGSILGASLLFAGTAIGAGMLALPAETLDSGFGPTLSGLIICWVFTYITSLAVLESSWTALQLASVDASSSESSSSAGGSGGSSFLSISRRALGVPGEIVTGVLFWFLLTAIV
ncbi:MAG: aromatic amino acid transport family protein, partial [Promethearchaeia archaeon]